MGQYPLKCFAPFIKPQKKENIEDCEDEEELITQPEPYFEDKVTFLFQKEQLCLFVLVDELKYEKVISSNTTFIDYMSFCLSLPYLKQEVERNNCEVFEFVEDRFTGFIVNNAETKENLFDINAYSVRLQKEPHTFFHIRPSLAIFPIERFILLKALVSFNTYTHHNPRFKNLSLIWFLIENGYCNIFASNGMLLRLEKYPVNTKDCYIFSIPGAYAIRIYNVISKWEYTPEFNIEYDGQYISINNSSSEGNYRESFELPANIEIMPNVYKILDERIVNHKATIKASSLRSTLGIINAMKEGDDKMVMHFKYNHVNIYWKDKYQDRSVYEFKDIQDCDEEFDVALHVKTFDTLLNEIKTDNAILYFFQNNKLDILSENETLFGNTVRIMVTSLKGIEECELLEEGDKVLQNDQRYLDKYYPKTDEEIEEEEVEEEEDGYERASIAEMHEEAVLRMKSISLYSEIIKYFEEENEPQVYEPPYGAGYSLEEEELEELHQTESRRHILIWGVIRSFTKFNKGDATIDHYLFVSDNKEDWEKERQDLKEGIPFVYTTMKEYPLKDYGHINIYMSEGGTPLRQ